MTVGIYALYWEEQDLIYIGESDNIERRFKEHPRMLIRNKHINYKVQEAYNTYGVPIFQVLEECCINELKIKEVVWCNEFTNILNIAPPGSIESGVHTRHSKYSKFKILRIFSLLYKSTKTHKEIADKVSVPRSVVSAIANGSKHSWIREEYSREYNMMVLNRPKINQNNHVLRSQNKNTFSKMYPTVLSPTGQPYNFTSIASFCRSIPELALNIKNSASGIDKVVRNVQSQYKGWVLA